MTSLARRERDALCATAAEVGPDAPTLCTGWTVKDLVAHLVLREGSIAALGIAVAPLAGLAEHRMTALARQDFDRLVERLRGGPPVYSPIRIPAVDRLVNTVEFFIHHEDIRRAQPGWEPRALPPGLQKATWQAVTMTGRRLVGRAPVGVVAERSDSGESVVLRDASPSVRVSGPPAEVAIYVFGRQAHARVDVTGAEQDVDALGRASLGG
jgi:uncharacterized protein (TIGR03085 family)